MIALKTAVGAGILLFASTVLGYEQATHAAMTNAAIERSRLGAPDNSLVLDLGLVAPSALDLLGRYFELVDPFLGALGASERRWMDYENGIIADLVLRVAQRRTLG
jgi:hypothetical protein